MRLSKWSTGGLALVLLLTVGLSTTGCSLTEAKDKAALLAAITAFTAKAAPLGVTIVSTDANATVTADGTPVTQAIKDGVAGMADDWQSVVDHARMVDGADAAAAETAWSNLQAAAAGIPDGATAGEAGAVLQGPLNELLTVRDQLRAAALSTK